MNFSVEYCIEVLPKLLDGAVITIYATIVGMVIALALGLLLAIARKIGRGITVFSVDTFVLVIRSTPLLIQLYIMFYVLPLYGISFSPFVTGVLTLGVHYATFISEVFRAGIEAVPKGQWEAAHALNFPTRKLWLRVIVPQTIRPIIPQLGNYLIQMYKHAALLATITVIEVLGAALNEAGETFRYLEIFTLVGIIYFIIGYTCSLGVRRLESHYSRSQGVLINSGF